jgi:hypothetical protein
MQDLGVAFLFIAKIKDFAPAPQANRFIWLCIAKIRCAMLAVGGHQKIEP